ncbi:uncharacterized protein TNCV_4967261 [Trichonephila clavipes]|nr:uncharacterized protein TNCV_4967261 [Trichonephila clavipes]
MINPTRKPYSTYLLSNLNVSQSTLGVVGNNSWSTEAHEWDFYCSIPYPTVSSELYVPKHLHIDLHCIRLSAQPLCGADFSLPTD